MKKVLSLVAIGVFCCLLAAGVTGFYTDSKSDDKKKDCFGYTIIEAGKGIDCNGDTINLVRKQGFVELTSKKTNKNPV
jgi:hypothetical protein